MLELSTQSVAVFHQIRVTTRLGEFFTTREQSIGAFLYCGVENSCRVSNDNVSTLFHLQSDDDIKEFYE